MSTEPRGVGRQNLGGAFSKRTEGLDNPLPPITPAAPSSQSEEQAAPPATTDPKPAKKKAATRSSAAPAAPKPSKPAPAGSGANKAVYVEIELRDKLRAYVARHPGQSYTAVILTAIESTLDQLREDEHDTAPAGSLFERSGRGRRRDGRDRAQITMRLTPRNEEVLDQLVEDTGAQSRSDLVSRALTHYLT